MIFFIGMPGSGKSYWGSTVATAYNLPFIDMDSYVETKIGMSIADYFEQKGEHEFRLREQESLQEIIAKGNQGIVVSCGGGTPVFADNLAKMNEAGCTIYIKASLNVIMKRLENSSTRRPLLEGKDLATALMGLYEKREPFFSQAGYIFDVEEISVANFEQIINTCTSRH